MYTSELVNKINSILYSKDQVFNQLGFYDHEPQDSYRAKQFCSNNGIVYWLSTSRNQKTNERIFYKLTN